MAFLMSWIRPFALSRRHHRWCWKASQMVLEGPPTQEASLEDEANASCFCLSGPLTPKATASRAFTIVLEGPRPN